MSLCRPSELRRPQIHQGLRMLQAISVEENGTLAGEEIAPDEAPGAVPRTALDCLSKIATHHGVDLPVERLLHGYALDGTPVSANLLLRMAKDAGLRAQSIRIDWSALFRLGEAYPALVPLTNGNWILVLAAGHGSDGVESVKVFDPLAERQDEALIVDRDLFCARWNGEAILIKREQASSDGQRVFGLRWFVPELLRQRRLFADVAIAAILLYALGLALPIFFQLVIDKVLVHESFTTLYVLAAGAIAALTFDAIFNFLRRYLLLYATNKVDIRVATKTFGHLLGLPVTFFEHISAGVLVKHMQQAARIREFLTGRLFLTMLDLLSLFVFVPVLALYSMKLTCVVLAFTVASGLVVASLMGPFRRRLYELYQAEGARQALLVETVHGMRTVKSLAMEPRQGRVWDDRCAQSVSMRFGVEKISAGAQAITGFLEKMMTLGIISLGALDVFSGTMTIGALVAFNMLAGRVSGPLVQLVTMVHEYQEVALSVKMLGEVMNQKPERDGNREGLMPEFAGKSRVRERVVPLWRGGCASARRCVLFHRSGNDLRYRRPERVGQDDADSVDFWHVSGAAGAASHRWIRFQRARSSSSAPQPGNGASRQFPFPRHCSRKYRLCEARCDLCRGRAGRPDRGSGRVHRAAAARLRYHAGGEWVEPVGRSEAAFGHRQSAYC